MAPARAVGQVYARSRRIAYALIMLFMLIMAIRLSCVLGAAELAGRSADIVLFPEGVEPADMALARAMVPGALIVGAVEERGRSRALIERAGRNQVDYRKIETDGRTKGAGVEPRSLPLVLEDRIAIGVVICMDIQRAGWVSVIIGALRAAPAPVKLLCIAGDMSDMYFQGQTLQPYLHGVKVALCNNTRTHPRHRCQSFVADASGAKRVVQTGVAPVHVELIA